MIKILAPILLLAFALPVSADPIRQAMTTPASVFDMFLYRLNEESKCRSWLPNTNIDEPTLCLTGLRYNSRNRILKLYFREYPYSENLNDFVNMNDLEREEFLLRYIDRVAQRAGVVNDWGMIHSIPVTTGGKREIDETAFRTALAGQSEVHLTIEYSGSIYAVSRMNDGNVEFEIR